jgi:hypothetical protein
LKIQQLIIKYQAMKKIFLLALFWSAALSGLGQGVVLYKDCNYRGGSATLGPGRYELSQTGIGAYQLSSIRINSGYKVIIYNGAVPGTGDRKVTLTSSVSCFDRDWNDKVGSVVIEQINGGSGGGYDYPVQQPIRPAYGSGPQVMLFEDCSLRGYSSSLSPGRYNTRQLGIRNDALSSIRIPSGWNVTVYKEGDFRGSSRTFYSNVYCLDGEYNDQASSIVVTGPGGVDNGYIPPQNNNDYTSARERVTVYDQCNFGGLSYGFSPGRYNYNGLGIGNDKISAIRIPNGFRITVYQAKDFNGASRTYTYDQSCLDGQWNNQISSMIIDGPGASNSNPSNDDIFGNSGSGISVYTASYYKGDHIIFGEGRHDLRNSAIRNNISSFTLQPGYRVTVYEEFGFNGRSQTFNSSVLNLAGLGWNDNIRSLIVTRVY